VAKGDRGMRNKTLKEDDTYIVPPGVARRDHMALSQTHAAWTQHPTAGGQPTIVTWSLEDDADPVEHFIANLNHPHSLTLGTHWLFYADDRYGDDDIFALHITTGETRTIAALPGDQSAPNAWGNRVVWQDCRECVAGGQALEREIYSRHVDDDTATRVTTNHVEDSLPAQGLIGDMPTLAWRREEDSVVVSSDAAATHTFDFTVERIALNESGLVIRGSHGILNPDSMIPSDVYLRPWSTGELIPLSQHAERDMMLDNRLVSSASRVGWLASIPGTQDTRRLTVVDVTTGETEVQIELDGISTITLTDTYLGFIAPRPDNAEAGDVWLFELP